MLNGLLLCGSLAGLAAVGEILLRVNEGRSDGTPLHAGGEPPFVPTLLPNVIAWRSGVEIRTNARGLRGADVAMPKPAGCLRIACLGDSYTFGSGVREGETIPDRLATELRSQGAGACVEVVNLGIEGANAYDNTARLEALAIPLDPDVVVYFFLFNDVWQMERGVEWMANRRRQPEDGKSAQRAARRQSYLVRYLAPRAANLARALGRDASGKLEGWDAQFVAGVPAWENTKERILRARDRCREGGVTFVLALLPAFAALTDGAYPLARYRAEVLAFCREAGIDSVDLHEPFWGHSGRKYWINALDPHPNEEACAIIAAALAEHLADDLEGRGVRAATP